MRSSSSGSLAPNTAWKVWSESTSRALRVRSKSMVGSEGLYASPHCDDSSHPGQSHVRLTVVRKPTAPGEGGKREQGHADDGYAGLR